MRRWFLVAMCLLIGGVLLFGGRQNDPGYILISYGQTTLEMTVWVGIALLLVLFLFMIAVVWLWRLVLREGGRVGGWFSGRRQRRSQQLTTRGVIAYVEGHWQRARTDLLRAASSAEAPLLNYLFAARASSKLADDKQVKKNLQLAEQSTSGATLAVEVTKAELYLENGRLEDCLATLMRVREQADRHPYILKLLKSVYIGLNDWRNLATILPELRRYQLLEADEQERLELQAALAGLKELGRDAEALKRRWRELPKVQRRNAALVAEYVQLLLALNQQDQAEEVLRQQLNYAWSESLINLYGRIRCQLPDQQLIVAEAWLKQRNNDADLLLALGRICLQNELWGKARDYFESSLKLSRRAQTCAELARLLAYLGDHERSNQYFQQGLLMITDQLPEIPAYRHPR